MNHKISLLPFRNWMNTEVPPLIRPDFRCTNNKILLNCPPHERPPLLYSHFWLWKDEKNWMNTEVPPLIRPDFRCTNNKILLNCPLEKNIFKNKMWLACSKQLENEGTYLDIAWVFSFSAKYTMSVQKVDIYLLNYK
jgi:hypothetical protein